MAADGRAAAGQPRHAGRSDPMIATDLPAGNAGTSVTIMVWMVSAQR
jgi:hypothetical protein